MHPHHRRIYRLIDEPFNQSVGLFQANGPRST